MIHRTCQREPQNSLKNFYANSHTYSNFLMPWLEYSTGELGQYHDCWCPGNTRTQRISSCSFDYEGIKCPCLPWGGISVTKAISVSRNDRKCNYVFMFPKKKFSTLKHLQSIHRCNLAQLQCCKYTQLWKHNVNYHSHMIFLGCLCIKMACSHGKYFTYLRSTTCVR